ncbi:MAG: hypothetical protein BKPUNTRY_002976, partial [Candidatus Fervidibacter sp.]
MSVAATWGLCTIVTFIFTETQRVEAVIACQCLESLGVLVLQEDAERMALTLAGDIP